MRLTSITALAAHPCDAPSAAPRRRRARRLGKVFALLQVCAALSLAAPVLSGCHGGKGPEVPASQQDALGKSYASALEAEQIGTGDEAIRGYVALVLAGLAAGDEGIAPVLAGLDALVWRDTLGLDRVGPSNALAFRTPGGMAAVEQALSSALSQKAGHPLARSFVAQTLLSLAQFRGDAEAAARWRTAMGTVQRVAAVGPLSWSSLTAVRQPTALEEGPLRASYEGAGPFAAKLAPLDFLTDGGVVDVSALNTQGGLYAAAFDAEVASAQRAYFTIESTSSAVLVVGGKVVVTRPFTFGGGPVMRMGYAELPAGKTRVVVRLANNDDGSNVRINALAEDGAPLSVSVPHVGDDARGKVTSGGPIEVPIARESPALSAAALLSLGDARGARRLLEGPAQDSASPAIQLLYARALGQSDDVPEIKRIERARTAYAKAHEGWPKSWEATIGDALHAAARKGPGEGRVETLRDLAEARASARGELHPLVTAFESATAMEIGARDVAYTSFEKASEPLKDTPLHVAFDERIHPRVGAEAEALACTGAYADRQSLACLQQKARRGDSKGVYAEIERLRALHGSERSFQQNELAQRFSDGDEKAVLALYDKLLPGERTMTVLGMLPAGQEAMVRAKMDRDRTSARDTPGQLPSLLRLLGEDPAVKLEKQGLEAVEADRKQKGSTSATLVLLHTERYELSSDGLLRSVLHDVRRVAGTTDVEQGVGGTGFGIVGRETRRILRRKIHKKDGRVLEPDRAAMASQGNSDLSQLEPGDYIEQIIESFALPDKAGHIVVDTPDLLPERTSIREASIEVRYPKSIKLATWANALLGKPETRDEGDTRVVKFTLKNAQPRRIEEGVPRMDRDVCVSFGTYTWADVSRHLGELVRSMEDDDPFVERWAREAAGSGAAKDKATVAKIVTAAGKTIKVAQGGMLSDVGASMVGGSQRETARHIIELGQGSRSWVIYRALSALDIKAEIVLAERDPFSADPNFPARPFRFDKPLVVAHTAEGDVWIDADVNGPPLPAGRVSPELRGRQALSATGEMVQVQGASAEDARDEVDIQLKVDARGDATGTFTIQLRGRQAQGLADALERVVGTDRREMLRSVVLGWLPWANVNEVQLSSGEGSWEVSLRAEVAIPSFAQGEGKDWVLPGLEPLHAVFPRPAVATVGATYATRLGRQSALAIDSTFQYRVRRRIELPDGAKVTGAASALTVDSAPLEATRKVRVEGRTIDEEFTLSLSTGTIEAKDYDRFAREAKRLDDGFLAGTRVSH